MDMASSTAVKSTPLAHAHWGEFDVIGETTSVLDLKEVVPKELVDDIIEKSCSVEYTKGDPLDGFGDDDLDAESHAIDSEVLYSLELKKHTSALKQLIALAQAKISAQSSQPQKRLPDAPPAPRRPQTHLKHPTVYPLGFLPARHTPFTLGQGTPPEELSLDTCLYVLTKSISALAAHSGWDACMGETLYVFRDVIDDFLRRLTGMLRVAVDQEALQRGNNFPDPVEQVFLSMGLGSIRDLHSYYQVQILGRIEQMEKQCLQLTNEYTELAESFNMTLPSSSVWDTMIKQENVSEIEEGEDADQDVPELHFPGTSDSDLTLQPSATLRTGFEMLHSLERQQLLIDDDTGGNDVEFEDLQKEDKSNESAIEMASSSSSHFSKRARRT